MAGVFRRLSGAFQNDRKKDETHADIVRELTAEVKAIQETERDTVDGASVFSHEWGAAGDLVFIINLVPMYKLIGGREGRLAESLRETCKSEFAENIGPKRGKGSFQKDCFFMRFDDLSDQASLEQAVSIVNKIGYRTFGASFKTMEVPELLVGADAGDITTQDGKLDIARAKEVIASGGLDLDFGEPADNAPRWMKLVWQKVTKRQKLAEVQKAKKREPQWEVATPDSSRARRKRDDMGWAPAKADKEARVPRDFVKRGPDRRKAQRSFEGGNRRQTFDRRGRGY